ncbi:MAG: phosphatase PAP2 family protein [Clostridiaceae bacterium]|uniref:phosphatase PAP2 family protein n=1 Tax=Clostridium TaxID=1485 RepID=UPI0012B1CFCD|nr:MULTISPECIES: phosphatase PAP2 family protein [Clostridium]MCI6138452.1 phosphatase PAP2 family protein [Clostridium sp.]MDY3231145.1 phosphatase PAP2 family protein [Clostridiaceae bacterium]
MVIDIELQMLYGLQELRTPVTDRLLVFVTSLADKGWLWLLLGSVLFAVPKTRRLGGCMLVSMGIGALLGNVLLKNIVARPRPCWLEPSVQLLIHSPKDFSFPSGHTLVSFEGAVSIYLFNKKWGLPACMLALLIAFSRLYLFVHFPTDVLAGAAMGTVIAYCVFKGQGLRDRRESRRPRSYD